MKNKKLLEVGSITLMMIFFILTIYSSYNLITTINLNEELEVMKEMTNDLREGNKIGSLTKYVEIQTSILKKKVTFIKWFPLSLGFLILTALFMFVSSNLVLKNELLEARKKLK